jgi:hypothetical protein
MGIILTLAHIYTANIVNNYKKLFLSSLFIIAAIYNGFVVSSFLNEVSGEILTRYISLSLFIFTLARRFFPFLMGFNKPLQDQYPVNSIKKYCINLASDSVLTLNFVVLVIFLACLFIKLGNIGINEKAFIGFSVLSAYILRRLFQTIIFQNIVKGKMPYVILIVCSDIAICAINIVYYNYISLYYFPVSLSVLLVSGFLMEEKLTRQLNNKTVKSFSFKNVYSELLFSSTKFKLWFFASVTVKIVFLSLITVLFYNKHKYPPSFFIVLFTAPLTLFNYVLNNLFGFFDTYWFSLEKSDRNGFKMFVFFLKLVWMPLSIDAALFIIFCAFNNSVALQMVIIYAGSLPILTVLSFYWSVLFPRQVEATLFNSKATTSFLPIALTALICFSFMSVATPYWLGAIMGVYLIASIVLIEKLDLFYNVYRVGLYSKLFRK